MASALQPMALLEREASKAEVSRTEAGSVKRKAPRRMSDAQLAAIFEKTYRNKKEKGLRAVKSYAAPAGDKNSCGRTDPAAAGSVCWWTAIM